MVEQVTCVINRTKRDLTWFEVVNARQRFLHPASRASFCLDYEQFPTPLKDGRASETRGRVKITPREKGETRHFSLSPPRLAFLAWGDFHACSRFARSTIPEGEWGRLVVYLLSREEKRKLCLNRIKPLKSPQPELLDQSILFSFAKPVFLFYCKYQFIDKPMVITEPSIARARLFGLGS